MYERRYKGIVEVQKDGNLAYSSSIVPVAIVDLHAFDGRCIGIWSSWWGPVTKLQFPATFHNELLPRNYSVYVRTILLIILF
jgi:hypothetical protein